MVKLKKKPGPTLLGPNFSVYLTKQRDENYVDMHKFYELEMIQIS